MNWFKNRKISTKLISGFILVSVFFIIIGIFVITNILKITNLDRKLYQENTAPLSSLSIIQQDFLKIQVNLANMAIDTSGNLTKYIDTVSALSKDLSSNETVYLKSLTSPEQISDFNNLKSAITKYGDIKESYITFIKSGDRDGALQLMNGYGTTLGKDVDTFSNNLFNFNYKMAKNRSESNTNEGNKSIVIMASILLLVIILAIVLGFLIAKIISGPIKKLVEAANKISEGDLDFIVDIDTKDEVGVLGEAFIKIINSLKELIADTNMLSKAAVVGKLNVRADAATHNGDYRKIINGINKTLDTLVGHIDMLPSPVILIDKEFNIQYINKTGADLLSIPQSEIIGTKCYDNYKSGDCKTDNCVCKTVFTQGESAVSEAYIELKGHTINIQHTGIPLSDENGNIIGAMELIIDQTDIKSAMKQSDKLAEGLYTAAIISDKQAEFQKDRVDKLIVNLEKLSKGNLDIETSVIEVDDDTRQIGENFQNINDNLNKSAHAIRRMVKDVNSLINESIEGNLSKRADISKHEGDYKKIVEGINETLDAIVQPVQETSAVLKEMANGNLQLRVQGDYKGEHADIKNAMNGTLDILSLYVSEISEVLNEMASSNLNVEIDNEYKGDFQEIKLALNLIITSYNNIFTDINRTSDEVAIGSKQVSYGSQALSQGSTEQASAIEELTASITAVASQTKENSLNANKANELALAVKNNAEIGNNQMKEMLRSMEEINESSSGISKIIKVIDDIAFQTNILALNAAIEAARAGQAGKGFAVVAQEVRSLAARSANAAKQTADLIEGSIRKVESGTEIATGTAKSLNEIVNGISKVAIFVGGIASSSNQQATAISQINRGIEQVSKVIQTNSATAEESAAASEELSTQAELLKNMVGNFTLKEIDMSKEDNKDNLNIMKQLAIKDIL